MFFAPPKVKSLSQYAEFGVYFGQKHFFIMLGVAALVHALIIAVYMLLPQEEVIRIPVRVMNIKLTDGGGGESDAPAPAVITPPDVSDVPSVGGNEVSVRPVMPKIEHMPVKSAVNKATPAKPPVYSGAVEPKTSTTTAAHNLNTSALTEATLQTPKQYVRQSEYTGLGDGKGNGLGSGHHTSQEEEELIQRYEQTISLWIADHKTYPESAKRQGIEGDAIVRVRIDRSGHIVYNAIERTSGNSLIDAAVISMVQASDPVPAAPDDYPAGSQLEFLIPVSFRLQ